MLEEGRTYLSRAALEDLDHTIRALEKQRVPGTFIEAGCALGGSALVIAAAKRPARPFEVYDTFGMIPPPTGKDGSDVQRRYEEISSGRSKGIKGATYYGYQANLLQTVNDTFHRYGVDPDRSHVRFNPGLFEDTLRIAAPVAFASTVIGTSRSAAVSPGLSPGSRPEACSLSTITTRGRVAG